MCVLAVNGSRKLTTFRHLKVDPLVGHGSSVLAVGTRPRSSSSTSTVGSSTLDPEEAGADYADGLADSVDGYVDEVASLTEAIVHFAASRHPAVAAARRKPRH